MKKNTSPYFPEIVLGFSTAFALFMLFCRIYKTDSLVYAFLVWNTVLAWVPLVISIGLLTIARKRKLSLWLLAPAFTTWLLFLPNAMYILTDILHYRPRAGVPAWYDVILLVWFTWNGLIAGFLSLMHMHRILDQRVGRYWGASLIGLCIGLSSFGIYLGRYLRWNSWHVVSRPGMILHFIGENLSLNPMAHPRAVGMTVLLTLFLMFGYLMFRNLTVYRDSQLP